MMKTVRTVLLLAAASLSLAACNKGGDKPEGQVVATIDGKDITIHEVNAEVLSMGPQAQSVPRKLSEAIALSRVLERKMLAAEAENRKLNQSPNFVLAKARQDEGLLVQALQSEIAAKVPQTARETAQKFIAENPVMFEKRQVMTIDQIQFLQPANMASLPLKDAKTMAQVEQLLVQNNIQFGRGPAQVDTLAIDPNLGQQLVRLAAGPNGEPFMYIDRPAGAPGPVVHISVVAAQKIQPFLGEEAITYAQQLLQRQEISKRLQTELTRLRTALKDKITYASGFDTPEKVAAALDKQAAAEAAAGKKAAPAAKAAPTAKPAPAP